MSAVERAAEDSVDDAWDALYDTDMMRCCWCPSCNHYLPEDQYKPDEPCETVVLIRVLINAHVAEALAAAGCLRDDREGETVTEWGVRWIDVTGTAFEAGYIRMRGPNERPYATAEDARRDSSPVTHVVSRQRTTFPDVVTDWTPVTDGGDTDD